MLKRYLVLFTLFISLPFMVNSSNLPNWLFMPAQDSEQWFYTVGSGKNENDAKLNALGDLATRLSVTIDASTQSFVSSDNDQSFFENDITQQTETFTFNKVEILKTHNDNNLTYVLVKVERIAFFEDLTSLIQNQVAKVNITNDNDIETKVRKLIEWSWLYPQVEKKLQLLKAYKIDITAISSQIDNLQQQSHFFKNNLYSKLVIANSPDTLTLALEKHLQSFSTVRPSAGDLQLVFTGINARESNSDYHFHYEAIATLSYFYQSKMIFQKTLHASRFAKTLLDAKNLVTADLAQEVKAL